MGLGECAADPESDPNREQHFQQYEQQQAV